MLLSRKLYKNSVRDILQAEVLQSIIDTGKDLPVTSDGDLAFSSFQRDVLQKAFPGFTYEFCSTSTATTSDEGALVGITSVNLNLPDDVLMSYLANVQYDELTPLVYANPGRCLSYTHVCRKELVKEHPMFINHCHKYGIYHDISVGFIYPAHEDTFIVFDYLGGDHHENWAAFDHIKLELASFPFALTWLYRNKRLDFSKLQKMMNLLSGMTETRLLNLRKYINAPHQNLKEQAQHLGIQYGTLKESLGKIKSQTFSSEELGNNMPLRALETPYSFLRMLGDHTAELNAAKTPEYWT